jgi:hypothetical protein
MVIDAAVDELYGVAPAEFITAGDAGSGKPVAPATGNWRPPP